MGRVAWRTTLLPLLLPAIAIGAAIALDARWSTLDQVQASIVQRWTPLGASLAAAVIFLSRRSSGPERSRWRVALASLPYLTLASLLAVALVSPGEGHYRMAWIYVSFIVAAASAALHDVWLGLAGLTDRRAALLIGLIALAAFLSIDPYHRAVQTTASDEPHYLLITQSLQLDGDLDLRNDYTGRRYGSFYDGPLPDVHAIDVGTRLYPIRDLGLPVVSLPFFAIGGRLGVMALISLVAAALVAQLYLLLRDLDVGPRIALVATALVALLHPILTYASAEIEPELFAALLFVTAVRALRFGMRSSPRALAIASACAGLIGIFTTRGWFLSLGIGLCIAAFALLPRIDLVRRVLAGAVPFTLLLLLTSYVNCRMFPFSDDSGCYFMPSAGYFLLRDQQTVLSGGPQAGLAGLLFDRTFGLLSHAPLYVLAFAGVVPLWRRARRGHAAETAVLVIAGLLLIGYMANIAYWWADGMPSSRYLVAPLPLLAVLLALGIEALVAAWARAGWTVVALLAIPSAVVTALYTVQPQLGYDLAVDVQRTGYPGQLWAYVYEHWGANPGLLLPSVVRFDGSSPMTLAIWGGIAAVLVALGAFLGPGLRTEAVQGHPAPSDAG